MKIAFVVGTRPEFIKTVSLIKECEKRKINYFIIHTGQHYSYELDTLFFEELHIKKPEYNLNVGSSTHWEQTGKMMVGIERILVEERPDLVLVQGDTNTVLAGALSAKKLGIKVGHVEAGLRCYNIFMPEEINRRLTDHISDFLFCPTLTNRDNLIRENIDGKNIYVVGNTIVDVLYENLELSKKKGEKIMNEIGITPGNYFLVTAHRQENIDDKKTLINLLRGIENIQKKYDLPVIYPMHPRVHGSINKFSIKLLGNIKIIKPISYLESIYLQKYAKLILTDSGGIQEEACILGKPCVTLRENTERPETVDIGANVLAGTNPQKINDSVEKMLYAGTWKHPFGD